MDSEGIDFPIGMMVIKGEYYKMKWHGRKKGMYLNIIDDVIFYRVFP